MISTAKILPILFFCAIPAIAVAADPAAKPKYGPDAIPLSRDHGYFRKAVAPDYWAIAPYYVHQQDGRSCSVASITMVLNAIRAEGKLGTEDAFALQKKVVEKAGVDLWTHWLTDGKAVFVLDSLEKVTRASFAAYGIEARSIETTHVKDTDADWRKLKAALVANEKSNRDWIVVNYIQGVVTGDSDVGHIAPIGAYDASTDRVLIMDPDREWYEPYWTPSRVLLKAMAVVDPLSNQTRGYIHIQR